MQGRVIRVCKKCGNIVRKSDLKNYSYQCDYCDEDLYEFETFIENKGCGNIWQGCQSANIVMKKY